MSALCHSSSASDSSVQMNCIHTHTHTHIHTTHTHICMHTHMHNRHSAEFICINLHAYLYTHHCRHAHRGVTFVTHCIPGFHMIDASLFHALCRNDVSTIATFPSFESWDDYKYIIFLMHAYNRILYNIRQADQFTQYQQRSNEPL